MCIRDSCMGVPSPKIWREYLAFREREAGAAVSEVSFRDKSTGWKEYSLAMKFENGKEYQNLSLIHICVYRPGRNRIDRRVGKRRNPSVRPNND